MKIKNYIFLLVCVLLASTQLSLSQTYEELVLNTSSQKDIYERLPSVEQLYDIALENSPTFKMLDAEVKIGQLRVTEEKREWMNSLGVEGLIKHGLYDNLILTEDLGYDSFETTKTEQTRYSIGVYIKMPISAMIDKSAVKAAKIEKEQLVYQREARMRELKQLIIQQYNNVIKLYRTIVIKNNLVESYRTQTVKADIDFKNGNIDVFEYSRLLELSTKATLELEEAKIDFGTAFKILEEIVGAKITLKE